MNELQHEALERLLEISLKDNEQSRCIANFLLSWWNARTCGGFDVTDAWSCDSEILDDIVIVFNFIAKRSVYPDQLGYENQFLRLIQMWRPMLS
jgi:hypothetical protein